MCMTQQEDPKMQEAAQIAADRVADEQEHAPPLHPEFTENPAAVTAEQTEREKATQDPGYLPGKLAAEAAENEGEDQQPAGR